MLNDVADDVALPQTLHRVLAAFPELVAARAATALRTILRERLASPDARQWSSSTLTGDGFPVEFTFTTADDRLRYTAEPASWQAAPQHRLDTAIRLMDALAPSPIPDDMCGAWRQAQRQGSLKYGAWVGGRHGETTHPARPANDEYKIYVEVPETTDANVLSPVYPGLRLSDRTPTVRMVAYVAASRQHEAYYRVPSLAPYHLPRVLAPCGLEAHSNDVLAFLAEAYGHRLGERLPGGSVGVSYSMASEGDPQSVTLFLFARVFWGADARIRTMFGRVARATGWDDRRYQAITAPLASHERWTTRHGILGVTLARNGNLYLSIGVRPPAADAQGMSR